MPDVRKVHTDDQVRRWVADVLVATEETWVAERTGIHGFMTLDGTELDHLYVAVEHQGKGIGRRLLEQAKSRSPGLLELYTFQVNRRAIAFYLAQGFEIVDASDGSRNDEREPDFRLRWSPKSL
jgi:GNAT superfamily N-acetyltransferase